MVGELADYVYQGGRRTGGARVYFAWCTHTPYCPRQTSASRPASIAASECASPSARGCAAGCRPSAPRECRRHAAGAAAGRGEAAGAAGEAGTWTAPTGRSLGDGTQGQWQAWACRPASTARPLRWPGCPWRQRRRSCGWAAWNPAAAARGAPGTRPRAAAAARTRQQTPPSAAGGRGQD